MYSYPSISPTFTVCFSYIILTYRPIIVIFLLAEIVYDIYKNKMNLKTFSKLKKVSHLIKKAKQYWKLKYKMCHLQTFFVILHSVIYVYF